MSIPGPRLLPVFAAAAMLLAVPPPIRAADANSANGTLTIQSAHKPFKIDLMHAYYIIGPDPYEAGKTIRSIVFTAADQRAAIEACKDTRCVGSLTFDFLRLDLGDDPRLVSWAARIDPASFSGGVAGSALKLGTDSADRLAGTLTMDAAGTKTAGTIKFDASLVKTFAKPE
ncbi:MAG: hypothetical protein WB784_08485 [Rhodanobacteraceae bacterium]